MKKQTIIRIVVITAIVGLAVWKIVTMPKIMDDIYGEHAEYMQYKGKAYYSSYFMVADADRIHVGYAKETWGKVYFIGSRTSPDFIVIVGSDNTTNYAAEGCVPDYEGTVTKVLIDPGVRAINNRVITWKAEIEKVLEITNLTGEESEYSINNIYTQGNTFYFAYDDYVVTDANNLGGYVAFVDGEWIYASPANYRAMLKTENRQDRNKGTVRAVKITDEKMIDWLEKSIVTSYIEK